MLTKIILAIRALIFYIIFMVLATLVTILLYLALPFPFKVRLILSRAWSKAILKSCQWLCGLNYQVIGQENLLAEPVIFLSKHQSAWETIVFPGLLPPNCFVFKKSLLLIPIFGWGMAVCRHIPVDRSAGIKAFKHVIELGKKRLQQGLSIIIFPEGTRVAPKTNGKFHKTAASLAKSTGAKVIPIALNSGSYWCRKSFIKHPGTITVIIGPAIDSTKLNTDEINDQAYHWINQTMTKLES